MKSAAVRELAAAGFSPTQISTLLVMPLFRVQTILARSPYRGRPSSKPRCPTCGRPMKTKQVNK